MKSPFPGMDPYLEERWVGIHMLMISAITAALQPRLPRDLRARPEQRVILEMVDEGPLSDYRSDLAVIERPAKSQHEIESGDSSVSVAAPIKLRTFPAPLFDRFIRIVDVTEHDRVVTAIEVLSPWNKRAGKLNRDYRRKVRTYTKSDINFCEIDLLRSSRQRLPFTWRNLPPTDRKDYLVLVHRAKSEDLELYPISLRERLPAIAIPLRPNDQDVPLELQSVIARVYTEGGYDDIDYGRPPDPPLSVEDARWASDIVAASRRPA